MQLDEIRAIYDKPGPYVTLHLDVSRTTEDARQQLDSRWTTARHELEREGVAEALLSELESRVREPTHMQGEVRRTIVAARDTVLFDQVQPGAPAWEEIVTVGELPDLAGWAVQREGQRAFVLALVDREGADLSVCTGPGGQPTAEREVHGDDFDITKIAPGDWAQDKYQRRAENTWEANAKLVADTVNELCDRHGTKLVVVAGDVRAKANLSELLAPRPDLEVVLIDSGGRAAGVSEQSMWADIERVLAAYDADEHRRLVERLEQGTANNSGVARGLDEVLDALVRGEVEQLVLDLRAAHELTVDPHDHQGLALPNEALDASSLPADQVLMAAAARTGAGLALLPREASHGAGVAATLRW